MAGLDPSIPLQGRTQVSDPFQTVGNALQLKNALLQNQTNQAAFDSNQAASKAISDNTDSQGNVNWGGARAQYARSGVNYNGLQNNSGLTANNQQVQSLDNATYDTSMKRLGTVSSAIAGVTGDPRLGKEDMTNQVFGAVNGLVQGGAIPPQMAQQVMSDFPYGDPAAQKQWAISHGLRINQGIETLKGLAPTQTTINNGQTQTAITQNPITRDVLGSPYQVQNQLSPESNATLIPAQNPDGSTYYTTAGAARAATGAPVSEGGTGYTGRPAQPLTASNAPSTRIGQEAGATQSANVYTQDQNLGNSASTNLSTLGALRTALGGAGNTGPGSAALNTAKSWLVAHGMSQGDVDKVASYDEATKLMTQIANQSGAGTDARLDSAIRSNPNTNLSTKANLDIVGRLEGIERMNLDRQQAFQQSGLRPDQYQNWRTDWNKSHTLGTYQFDSLSPQQQQGYLGSMTPQQRQQWAQGYSDFKARSGGQQ